MPPVLQSQALSFHYGKREVFARLAFSIEPGAFVALLGANGVGKTTLLNIISGLLFPASGELLVDGRDTRKWTRRELSRFVSLVPQHLEVPFLFRVEEVVSQGRVPYLGRFGGLSPHDWEVVNRSMEQVDVARMRDRVFSELSGGEKQQVKIAIALAQQPKIMLLDEPTQHLDIGRQIEVLNLLRQLNDDGITIVAAVHDLSLVRDHFSQAMLLMNGNCISGTTSEVMRPHLLAQAFSIGISEVESFCEMAGTVQLSSELRGRAKTLPGRLPST
jgi:ABC-type cobalamin/Fe3+-siderophores transport system ATPase subunit